VGRMPAELWRDAQRLYVAITRGRNEVRFYYQNEASPFLRSMGDTVAYADAALLPKLKSVEVVAEIQDVEMPAEELVESVPEPLIEKPEEPLPVPAETDYFSDGSWYRITVINSEKIVTFRRQPSQIDLAGILGTTPTQISNWLHDGPNLHLVPSSPLEWHLVEHLAGKLDVVVEYHGKNKPRSIASAATSPSLPSHREIFPESNPAPLAGSCAGQDIIIGEVSLASVTNVTQSMMIPFSGGGPLPAKIREYPLTGPGALRLVIHDKRFDEGTGQVTCGANNSGDPFWQRIVNRLRQGIYAVPEDETFFMELEQARMTLGTDDWSSRYKATLAELDEGAGLSVQDRLMELGAIEVGTREEVYGEENRRKTWLCVSFAPDNLVVPLAAYSMTTILPLLHRYKLSA